MPVCFQRKKQYFLTFRQPSNFFLPFFCCLLLLAFRYEFLFNQLFPLFFHNMYLCDWKLQLNENFTNFTNSTFSFFLSCSLQTALNCESIRDQVLLQNARSFQDMPVLKQQLTYLAEEINTYNFLKVSSIDRTYCKCYRLFI